MTDPRDTDPDLSQDIDPTWLGVDAPAKSPAELAKEDRAFWVRVRIFSDRWGSPWLVVPVCIGALVVLWKILFSKDKPCPTPKN